MKFPEILIGKAIDPFLSVPGWQHRERLGLAGGRDLCQDGKSGAKKSPKPFLRGHLVTSEPMTMANCWFQSERHRHIYGTELGYCTDSTYRTLGRLKISSKHHNCEHLKQSFEHQKHGQIPAALEDSTGKKSLLEGRSWEEILPDEIPEIVVQVQDALISWLTTGTGRWEQRRCQIIYAGLGDSSGLPLGMSPHRAATPGQHLEVKCSEWCLASMRLGKLCQIDIVSMPHFHRIYSIV